MLVFYRLEILKYIKHASLLLLKGNFHRIVYFLACCFNTVSMMTSCVVFVMLVFLPCSSYVGRYHIMAIIILGAALLLVNFIILKLSVVNFIVVVATDISCINKAILQVATLVSITLAIFGLDASTLKADRVISRLQSPSLLTGFLRLTLALSLVRFPPNHFQVRWGTCLLRKTYSVLHT